MIGYNTLLYNLIDEHSLGCSRGVQLLLVADELLQ